MNYDMNIHSNPDAQAWAEFFVETVKKHPQIATDEATMIGWFANAMMAAVDNRLPNERARLRHKARFLLLVTFLIGVLFGVTLAGVLWTLGVGQ